MWPLASLFLMTLHHRTCGHGHWDSLQFENTSEDLSWLFLRRESPSWSWLISPGGVEELQSRGRVLLSCLHCRKLRKCIDVFVLYMMKSVLCLIVCQLMNNSKRINTNFMNRIWHRETPVFMICDIIITKLKGTLMLIKRYIDD